MESLSSLATRPQSTSESAPLTHEVLLVEKQEIGSAISGGVSDILPEHSMIFGRRQVDGLPKFW